MDDSASSALDPREQQILDLLHENPSGLSTNALKGLVNGIESRDLAECINGLLSKRLLLVQSNGDAGLIYMPVDATERQILMQLDGDETLIYQHIKASDNRGLWVKDLIRNTGLHRQVVIKCLKNLENRRIIKSVKSIKTPSKKIYMLFDVIPSVEITGGAWFTDNELDTEFVKTLSEACIRFIISKNGRSHADAIYPLNYPNFCSAQDVAHFINNSGLVSITLTETDVEELLEMLVYDGQLEKLPSLLNTSGDAKSSRTTASSSLKYVYLPPLTRPADPSVSISAEELLPMESKWTRIPCSQCPIMDSCASVGIITPSTCVYYDKWLQF